MYAISHTVCFNIYMYFGLSLQAAMCYIHIAALIAEYLKRKGKTNIFKTNYVFINIVVEKNFWLSCLPYVKVVLKLLEFFPNTLFLKYIINAILSSGTVEVYVLC